MRKGADDMIDPGDMLRRMSVRIAALLLLVVGAPALVAQPLTGEYRIGPRDLLEIKVLELPELNVERRVGDSGVVSLPLVGDIPVAGLTASESADRLSTILTAKYVNRANVTIVIKEFTNKPISVLGAVQRPGSLNVSGKWDLLQAISAAGGLRPDAGKRIYVLRRSENGLTDRLEIATNDLFVNPSPKWNVTIYPSDVINIPARTPVRVFCLGEVRSPGALEFDSDDRITLLSAIAKAGGLTDRAARGSIRIKRRGADGRDTELTANYGRIVSGKEPDPVLRGDDVVVVKESFF
ncbi:MAG TPA: polysaccharide biosynthesis/export family protein [Thermoanaerobaculia bacterium]|nr:polysaccharide biosynthesis/export family protein [Thermoanaerobaculia bacterium]